MAQAADVLREGGVVAYPTDTLYGLGVDPRHDAAVARLFALKGRPATLAVPLIAASLEQAEMAGTFGAQERRLAQVFWPGPLTIIVPARPGLAARLLAGGSTVAIRVPAHPVAQALAAALRFCVTSTSANPSAESAPARPEELTSVIASGVDLLLDAGPAPGGPPSTIVEVTSRGLRLVRAGALAWDRVLKSLE
jgi:L-threonylcarbamoyladenylate synthase